MQQAPVSIRVVRDISEFQTMRDRWNELADNSVYPNIFTTWEWCSIWWKWYGSTEFKGELFILVVESENQIVGIFPLYRRKRALFFIGYGARPTCEYLGPIIRKNWTESVCEAAVHFLQENKKEWDSLFFESYALDDPGTTCFARRMKENSPSYSQEDEERFYLVLPETYEAYLATLSGHNRSKKKNRLNQADKKFGASFSTMELNHLEKGFPIMMELLKASRARLNQRSPYLEKNYYEFQKSC